MTGSPIGALLACGVLIGAAVMPLDLKASALARGLGLDLSRFEGVWHELGRTPNRFEDNLLKKNGVHFSPCFNAKAHYTLDGPNKLRMENTCLRRSNRGSVIRDNVSAVAIPKKGSGGRSLKVAFGRGVSRAVQRLFTGGGVAFWVYCVGPVNSDGLYDWAVISAARRTAVFLLTRDREISGNMKDRMLACARQADLPIHKLIYRQE